MNNNTMMFSAIALFVFLIISSVLLRIFAPEIADPAVRDALQFMVAIGDFFLKILHGIGDGCVAILNVIIPIIVSFATWFVANFWAILFTILGTVLLLAILFKIVFLI